MRPIPLSTTVALVMLVLIAAGLGYALGTRHVAHDTTQSQSKTMQAAQPTAAAQGDRTVLYWYDPMVPGQKFDKPGKSPYMDMELVPKYADEAVQAAVRIDPAVAHNLGMQTASVERAHMASGVTAVASVKLNERDVAIVQARTAGFVERVVPRAVGDVIAAGAPLADILVSEWAGAQGEYLAVRATGDAELTAAARQRLLLLGMSAQQIAAIERSGAPRAVVTISAPIGGVVQELGVRAGMTVTPGMTLARINGLSSVWLEAAVPEAHAALLAAGRAVKASFAAYPGETFRGKIELVLPEANVETRTLRVRMTFPNRDQRLKAGMFAQVEIEGRAQEMLAVPASAVVRTGARNLVFVADAPGRFRPVEVELGAERDGRVGVLNGLREGDKVAVSGQFLIDSEASLQGLTARAGLPSAPRPQDHSQHARSADTRTPRADSHNDGAHVEADGHAQHAPEPHGEHDAHQRSGGGK